jgi:hypothetical protein
MIHSDTNKCLKEDLYPKITGESNDQVFNKISQRSISQNIPVNLENASGHTHTFFN